MQAQRPAVSKRVIKLQHIMPLVIAALVIFYQLVIIRGLPLIIPDPGETVHYTLEIILYGVVGPVITWVTLGWIRRWLQEKEQVERRLWEQEQRMLQIRDEVSAQIAGELHDNLGPNLFAIALKADTCRKLLHSEPDQVEQELSLISNALQQSIRAVRRAVYALRPIELERWGLIESLRKLAADAEEVNDLQLHLTISGEERRLPSPVETGLFHIVQEALYNVRRHAEAKNVWLQLDLSPQIVCLQIRDDGRGFDSASTPEGVGLRHIRERTQALSGTFSLQATPGRGTELLVCLPIAKEASS